MTHNVFVPLFGFLICLFIDILTPCYFFSLCELFPEQRWIDQPEITYLKWHSVKAAVSVVLAEFNYDRIITTLFTGLWLTSNDCAIRWQTSGFIWKFAIVWYEQRASEKAFVVVVVAVLGLDKRIWWNQLLQTALVASCSALCACIGVPIWCLCVNSAQMHQEKHYCPMRCFSRFKKENIGIKIILKINLLVFCSFTPPHIHLGRYHYSPLFI